MGANLKGQGIVEARQLKADEKAKVYFWIRDHRGECERETADRLAAMMTAEVGFVVSSSTVNTIRTAVFPEMKRKRAPVSHAVVGGPNNIGKWIHRTKMLEEKVEALMAFKAQFDSVK